MSTAMEISYAAGMAEGFSRKLSPRAPGHPITYSNSRTSKAKLAVIVAATDYPSDVGRPVTRGDCEGGPRPCPFVSCKWHLYVDVHQVRGSLKVNFPDLEVWELQDSCALDAAEQGGATLENVGAMMNITRERVRQLETIALNKIDPDDLSGHARMARKTTDNTREEANARDRRKTAQRLHRANEERLPPPPQADSRTAP